MATAKHTLFTGRRFNQLWQAILIVSVVSGIYINGARADVTLLKPGFGVMKLGRHLSYMEDKYGTFTLDGLLLESSARYWKKNAKDVLSFGYTQSAYWIKGDLENDSDQTRTYMVDVGYPMLDYVTMIVIRNDRWDTWGMGDKFPFSQRPIIQNTFVVPVTFAPKEQVTVAIYVKSSSAMQIPVTVWEEGRLMEEGQNENFGFGLYYGAMMVMIVYNLFVFFSVREKGYLYYVLYVLSMALWASTMTGDAFKYFWPNQTQWNDQAILVTLNAVVFFALLFGLDFLDVRKTFPRQYLLGMLFAVFCACQMVGSLVMPYKFSIISSLVIVICVIVYGYSFILVRVLDGFRPARLFFIAWTMVLLGGVILAFNKFGMVPKNVLTENAPQIGSVLEVILLSFAMADRINWQRQERLSAQAIANSRERLSRLASENLLVKEKDARMAEDQAIFEQKKAREYLEKQVKAQTQELAWSLEGARTANEWLTSGISYARMIQLTILPNKNLFKDEFDDYFIWWEPRDQVGGDFYWVEHDENRCIIAVADCTGHGVPGSFMTLVAYFELKRIIHDDHVYDPGRILSALNKRIKKVLKQDVDGSQSDEGLDIGICVLDYANRNIAFTGARHDLLYTFEKRLHKLKGNRQSVGYVTSSDDYAYTVHTLTLRPGMDFYLFTDGIADQPCDLEGVRFGKKQLEQVITRNCGQPLNRQQKEMRKAFYSHKGGRDQVDDITMLGFRPRV